MTKRIARMLTWLLTVAIPVVIAACYGVGYRFQKRGKVIDRGTQQGIGLINVTCVHAADAGAWGGLPGDMQDQTDMNGDFALSYDTPCQVVSAVDSLAIDAGTDAGADAGANDAGSTDAGAVDGGPGVRTTRYKPAVVPFVEGDPSILIQLDRE